MQGLHTSRVAVTEAKALPDFAVFRFCPDEFVVVCNFSHAAVINSIDGGEVPSDEGPSWFNSPCGNLRHSEHLLTTFVRVHGPRSISVRSSRKPSDSFTAARGYHISSRPPAFFP